MFEHKIGYVEWMTEQFYALAGALGLHLPHKAMDHVWMVLFIVLGWTIYLGMIKGKFGVIPTRAQQVMEAYYRFIANLAKDIIGPDGARYVPLLGTLGIMILTGNLMGLIPLFKSPTANINVTFSCAITVFIYYHAEGIRRNGIVKYLKHFAGPVWWLAPIFVPIEVIGHFARPLSLSLRLFGNIFGEDTIIAILAGLALSGFLIPLPMMCLAVFTSLIQMLVFLMLSSVYIAGAIAHEESHEEHGHEDDYVPATAA
jgi:F-type H+-transporting ATPase subunit a